MGRKFKESKIVKIPVYNKLMAKYMLSLKGSINAIGNFATKNKIEYKPDPKAEVPKGFADTIKEMVTNKIDKNAAFLWGSIKGSSDNKDYVKHIVLGAYKGHKDHMVYKETKSAVKAFTDALDKVNSVKSVPELLGSPDLLQELSAVWGGKYGEAAKFALNNPVRAVNEFFPIVSVYKEILDQDSSEGEHQLKDGENVVSNNGNSGYKNLLSGWFSSVLPSFFPADDAKKEEDIKTKKVESEAYVSDDDQDAKDTLPEYASGDIDRHFQDQVDMVTGHAKHYCYNYAKLNSVILDFCEFNFQMETPLDNEIAKLALHKFATMTQQLVQAPQGPGSIGDGSTLLLGEASQDNAQKQIADGQGEL